MGFKIRQPLFITIEKQGNSKVWNEDKDGAARGGS
jgi:hypothetical protein